MQCMAGLDRLTSGKTWIGDVELTGLSEKQLTQVRRDRVGFIFQAFNLVPTLNALENIRLPLDIAGRKPDGDWLDQVIDALNLRDRLKHRPVRALGRPAAARRRRAGAGLAARASSSPTSPPASSTRTRRPSCSTFMRRAADEYGQTIVMVTHEPTAASRADRVLFLADGQIVDEMDEPTPGDRSSTA